MNQDETFLRKTGSFFVRKTNRNKTRQFLKVEKRYDTKRIKYFIKKQNEINFSLKKRKETM